MQSDDVLVYADELLSKMWLKLVRIVTSLSDFHEKIFEQNQHCEIKVIREYVENILKCRVVLWKVMLGSLDRTQEVNFLYELTSSL